MTLDIRHRTLSQCPNRVHRSSTGCSALLSLFAHRSCLAAPNGAGRFLKTTMLPTTPRWRRPWIDKCCSILCACPRTSHAVDDGEQHHGEYFRGRECQFNRNRLCAIDQPISRLRERHRRSYIQLHPHHHFRSALGRATCARNDVTHQHHQHRKFGLCKLTDQLDHIPSVRAGARIAFVHHHAW